MILNHVRTVVFIKYISSLAPAIFPPKTLIWNKMVLPASNSLKVLELVENELEKTSSECTRQYCFLDPILSRLKENVLEANNQKVRKPYKILHQHIFCLIMSD